MVASKRFEPVGILTDRSSTLPPSSHRQLTETGKPGWLKTSRLWVRLPHCLRPPDGTGIRTGLRNQVFRVRLPGWLLA